MQNQSIHPSIHTYILTYNRAIIKADKSFWCTCCKRWKKYSFTQAKDDYCKNNCPPLKSHFWKHVFIKLSYVESVRAETCPIITRSYIILLYYWCVNVHIALSYCSSSFYKLYKLSWGRNVLHVKYSFLQSFGLLNNCSKKVHCSHLNSSTQVQLPSLTLTYLIHRVLLMSCSKWGLTAVSLPCFCLFLLVVGIMSVGCHSTPQIHSKTHWTV